MVTYKVTFHRWGEPEVLKELLVPCDDPYEAWQYVLHYPGHNKQVRCIQIEAVDK